MYNDKVCFFVIYFRQIIEIMIQFVFAMVIQYQIIFGNRLIIFFISKFAQIQSQGRSIILSYNNMALQIESQIYKWLQGLKIIRDGKRGSQGKIQIPQPITARLFDGLLVAQIAKKILRQRNEEEAANKLQAIKQNSTPAIRLYNWNLLSDALKKLGFNLDYSLKSKLLNLEEDALIKIIKHLWTLRAEEASNGQLSVAMSEVGQKSLKQASNVFQFLVISICNHFKLSVQHALNLFLDNNKYLAHLLVKGVKGTYEPVLFMLKDCSNYMGFIVDTLFCVDEKESLALFLGAIKPCLISKEQVVAEKGFIILKELIEIYMQKGTSIELPAKWMESDGLDTIFFSIKRHPKFFSSALSIAYAYLQDKFFNMLAPVQKSLLWNSQKQKLAFYYQLLSENNEEFIKKFIESPVFEQWNRACLRLLKKSYLPEEQYPLLKIYEQLWIDRTEVFQKSQLGLPAAFILFLKNCASSAQEIIFIQTVRILFNLTVKFGLAKKPFAPTLYKTIISILSIQSKPDRIQYLIQGFLQLVKDIPSLPTTPLAQSILKFIEVSPSASILQMAKIMLAEGRLGIAEKDQLQSALAKLMFSDVHFGNEAQQILSQQFTRSENQEDMQQFCSAALAQFYSVGREVHKNMKQLKQDFSRFHDEQYMKRGEPSFLRNLGRYIGMNNIILFLQKAIFSSINCKEQLQPHIFHTYIRIEKELKKEHISRMLMPLLKSYYDQGILGSKIEEYLQETYPPVLQFQSLAQSQSQDRGEQSPAVSSRLRSSKKLTLKTEQNNRSRGIESIRKDLDMIKKKRQQQKERSLQKQKERSILEQKKQLFYSVLNEKRIVEHGKSRKTDVDYHNLFEFDTAKTTEKIGLPELLLLDLRGEEEKSYIEDVQAIMKKYKKLWRFIFFRYSSFGLKGHPQGQQPEQKISAAEIWKFLKQYKLQGLKRQEALALVKRVNDHLKRKGDPQYLSYLAFQEYIIQYCFLAFRKSCPSNSPGRQIMELVSHLRSFGSNKGISTEMFDSPEQMFFQQTDVIREFNARLKENPEYPLPEGYKKVKHTDIKFNYTVSESFTGFKEGRKAAVQVLQQIIFKTFGFHMVQPLTTHEQKCLARPALFQKIKEKLKDYSGGYLMPKKSAYLPKIEKETSAFKPEFHLFTEFSLGIKLGLAGVDYKNRFIAEEVAYWLDDALDAVEGGRLKVGNKSKTHVQNQLIKKKMSEALQSKIEKQHHQKWQRSRAESVKNQALKYLEDKKQQQKKIQQSSKLQKQKRRQQQELALQKKKLQFQEAKSILEAKRKAIEDKKEGDLKSKRKQKQQYKKNVEQYFKKKKEQLSEKSNQVKLHKELQTKQLMQKKSKELLLKQKLEIQVFRKQQEVLQKVVETRQSYEQAWKSDQVQKQIKRYRSALKLVFDLLLKYQKSKISSTGSQQLGLNTLNFYMLRTRIIPLLIQKNTLGILFKAINKNENHKGVNFAQFEQLLFKIAVKGKSVLNSRKRQEDDQFQMIQLQKSLGKSNISMQLRKNKSNLTEEYTLDANGVTELTVRRMMEYLNLIDDKLQAQLRFRKLLEKVEVKPNNVLLKQAKSLLDSTVL